MAFRNTKARQKEIERFRESRSSLSRAERYYTKDMRDGFDLERKKLQRTTSKDLAKLSTADIKRMNRATEKRITQTKKTKGANVMLLNNNGVEFSQGDAKAFVKAVEERNDVVTQHRKRFESGIRKGANVPEGEATPEQAYAEHNNLRYMDAQKLKNVSSRQNLERMTANLEAGNKVREQKPRQFYENFKKAVINELGLDNEQVKDFNNKMRSLGVEEFTNLYYAHPGIFDFGFIYDTGESGTNNKYEQIMGKLKKVR